MVQGGMKCVKYILFAFNLLFFLAGLGLIITGAVVQTRFRTYFDFFGGSFSGAAIVLIVIGSIIFIIGFFGCCGAYKENYCMTMTFAALLIIIFIVEIGAGIAAYIMKEKVKGLVQDYMVKAIPKYGQPESEGITETWNAMQHDFQCCGANNASDWKNHGLSVPKSCCVKETDTCDTTDKGQIFQKGCVEGFVGFVKDNVLIIAGVGIGLAFVQVFGILLACCLARSIKKEYEVV